MPRPLTPRQAETVADWLRRNPTNAPMRPHEVWPEATPEAWRHMERARRLIRDRVLVASDTTLPERGRRYQIAAPYLQPPAS